MLELGDVLPVVLEFQCGLDASQLEVLKAGQAASKASLNQLCDMRLPLDLHSPVARHPQLVVLGDVPPSAVLN